MGEEYVTNEKGLVRIPRLAGPTWVCAIEGGRQGITELRLEERVQSVRIYARHSLRALVVDKSGTPQPKIPVRLVVDNRTVKREYELFVGAPATPETIVTISDVQARMATHGYSRGTTRYFLLPKVTLDDHAGVEVFPDNLPSDPVRVLAPLTGSVQVRVQDLWGRQYQGEASVRVYWPTARRELSDMRACENGQVVFPHVSLHAPFNAVVRFGKESGHDSIEIAHSPLTRPNEEAVITVRVAPPEETRRVVRGRLFGADGIVLPSQPCIVQPLPTVGFWDLHPGRASFSSEADGTFQYVLPADERYETLSIYRADADPSRRLDQAWRLDFEVPPIGTIGVFDVDDVYMKATPGLVSGRATRGPHQPAAGVRVFATVTDARYHGTDPSITDAVKLEEGIFRFATTTDHNGHFALFTDLETNGGTLTADLKGCTPILRWPFVQGQTGVELVMQRGMCIRGSLLVDEGVPLGQLSMVLYGPQVVESLLVRSDGTFYMDGLAPGDYSLEVRLVGENALLHRVSSIQLLRSPDTGGDGVSIDLRGKLVLCDVAVANADGIPIRGCEIVCTSPERAFGVTDAGGHVRMVSLEPSIECVIKATGFRSRLVTLGAGLTSVVMAKGIPIRIELEGDMNSLSERLRPAGKLVLQARGGGDRLHAYRHGLSYPMKEIREGVLEWMVSEPGQYVLKVGIEAENRVGLSAFWETESLSFPLDVVESSETQVFSISVSPEQLADAVQSNM